MGRAKLKLHKLDGSNRIGVYSRRKKGLLKKANELSVLCDIDIFLAMFSPGGKPSVYKSDNSSFEDMITKFAEVNPEERAKRKMECLDTIKKACKKSDHDVDIGQQLCPGDLTTEDITFLSHSLRIRLSDIEGRVRLWKNLEKIDSIQQLRTMEDSISKSLNEIAKHKCGMGSLIFGAGQDFQPSSVRHGMDSPLNSDARKEFHPCSSVHACDSENIDVYEDMNSFDSSLHCDTGQDFQASSLMHHGMNLGQELYQCSSVHGENMDVYEDLNSFPLEYLEEPSFSFESYTNLVCSKEIEVSMPESVNFVPGEIFLDCEVNQEDIVTEFGFTFDVPQQEQTDDQGNDFDCSINKGSRLPHSDLVNIHDSSKSASGTCENMILAESLHFLYGMDSSSSDAGEEFSTSSSIKHGINLSSTQLDAGLSVNGGDSENMDNYKDLIAFDDSCLKFEDEQEFQSSSSIGQYSMNSPVSFDAGQELHRSSSVNGGDSESINGYEDLNLFVQGFLDDPPLSMESCTDLAGNHEVENYKPGYENCSEDKMFLDCQLNQENIEMAFKSNIDFATGRANG
ncbi:PREDICTED: uncharacterized protein LOC109243042 [Nicotiana attenuata]|uniref:uncharacterized protein LOC109243042 n=1 Tax=Nicotiana attenuata TaxID=49451 RepID=UPI0009058F74|nr:PREDICTED: uncharacterized protein LOC109243042 [Nicotiana attenuata]